MLGAMRAIARSSRRAKVIAVVPSSENMPRPRRNPGSPNRDEQEVDEVITTDARPPVCGRVAYAKQLGCTHLSCCDAYRRGFVVALSNVNIGVFGSISVHGPTPASSKSGGEKMWPLPWMTNTARCQERHRHIQNVGTAKAEGHRGAMSSRIYRDTPWIHLDIAGTAWQDDVKPWRQRARPAWGSARWLICDEI